MNNRFKLVALFNFAIALGGGTAFGQAPQAFFLNKTQGAPGEILSISGSNFGGDQAATVVQFGAARGNVIFASNNTVEVIVPPGATYTNVSVTNTANGLTSYSFQQFGLNFNGTDFEIDLVEHAGTFDATPGLADLSFVDLDLDGMSDIVTTGDEPTGNFKVLRNTSSNNTVNFNSISITVGNVTSANTSGDLDGDGLPDVVMAEFGTGARRLFLYQNTSTPGNISLVSAGQPLVSLGDNPSRMVIKDLDFDGKPEITVTNESTNTISIFRNTGTKGNISFDIVFALQVTGVTKGVTGLAVEDLNLDGLPEIVINTFLDKDIFVFRNISTASGLDFEEPVRLEVPGALVTLRLADFNQDDLPDIAASELLNGRVSILENQSSVDARTVAFGDPLNLTTVARPWGIAVGEIDGDGKVDLVVASIQENEITVLRNNTVEGGAISFERLDIDAEEITRNVQIGDLNGDGKPDIGLTGIDNDRVVTFVNKNCFIPQVSPAGLFEICPGFPLSLSTLEIAGATYDWLLDGTSTGITTSSIDAGNAGDYTVTTTSESGACVHTSEAVNVTFKSGTPPNPVTADNGGLVCPGETAELFASDLTGATYLWEGPNGFTSIDQNPVVDDFTAEKAGRYTVEVTVNQCQSTKDTTLLETSPLPFFAISGADSVGFCQGKSVPLEVNSTPGFTIQWKQNGNPLTGETNPTYTASTTGTYTVDITNSDECARETPAVIVISIPPPVASFESQDTVCIGDLVEFTNTSETTSGIGVFYNWDLGNGESSTGENPSTSYSTPGDVMVDLMIK